MIARFGYSWTLSQGRSRVVLLAVLLLGAADVWGQTPTASTSKPENTATSQQAVRELSLEQLLDIEIQSVFGASKFLQKVTEAPAAVTVVTGEDITRYGWRTLADVLRSVRGFYVTDDRAWSYVGTRGFQRPGDYNTRMLLIVDGHRVNNNVYDSAAIQEDFLIDLDDVDRIEIIRGPSSSLYGSSAFFGVINVVTRPATDERSEVALSGGNLGLRTGRASFRQRLSPGTALAVSATVQRFGGNEQLYLPEFDDPASNFGVAQGLDYSRRKTLFGQLSVKGLTVGAGYNSRVRGVPTAAYMMVFNDPRSWVSDERYFASAQGTRAFGSWLGDFRASFDAYNYAGNYPYAYGEAGNSFLLVTRDAGAGKWVTSEARLSRRFGDRHRFTAGLEHRLNIAQDQTATTEGYDQPDLDIHRRSSTVGVYAQDEWRLHRTLLLNLGVRLDHYARFANPLKPRVAAIYQPYDHTTVKLLFGEAFRAPNTYETDYTYVGVYKSNETLEPEEIQTIEGVVEHYIGKRLRLSGSVFRYRVSGLIDLTIDPDDQLNHYANVDGAHARGFETEVEAKWPGGFQARLSHTFARARSMASNEVHHGIARARGTGTRVCSAGPQDLHRAGRPGAQRPAQPERWAGRQARGAQSDGLGSRAGRQSALCGHRVEPHEPAVRGPGRHGLCTGRCRPGRSNGPPAAGLGLLIETRTSRTSRPDDSTRRLVLARRARARPLGGRPGCRSIGPRVRGQGGIRLQRHEVRPVAGVGAPVESEAGSDRGPWLRRRCRGRRLAAGSDAQGPADRRAQLRPRQRSSGLPRALRGC